MKIEIESKFDVGDSAIFTFNNEFVKIIKVSFDEKSYAFKYLVELKNEERKWFYECDLGEFLSGTT